MGRGAGELANVEGSEKLSKLEECAEFAKGNDGTGGGDWVSAKGLLEPKPVG